MKQRIKRIITVTILMLLTVVLFSAPMLHGVDFDYSAKATAAKPFFDIFGSRGAAKPQQIRRVFPGGMPIGFSINPDGIIVVGFSQVQTEDGEQCPSKDAGIAIGDIITSVEGEMVGSINDLDRIINLDENEGRELEFEVNRGGKQRKLCIAPAKDVKADSYKIGVFVKTGTAGLGTVTYITEDMAYGALGHPVAEYESKIVVPVKEGTTYKCDILGYSKSAKGRPGALKGYFLKNKNIIGTVETNNTFGIFGRFDKLPSKTLKEPLQVAPRSAVKEGKAKILTTISNTVEEFDVEIIRKFNQRSARDKGMVVRVTDLRLLDKTRGIVQGMSGSPIIQNDCIVGAITHVFVNDPTCGYGIYIDFMLEQSDKLESAEESKAKQLKELKQNAAA